MKFLIVGGAGFIGQNLSAYACNGGHSVVACDLLKEFNMPQLKNYSYYCAESDENYEEDVDCIVLLAAIRPYADFSTHDYLKNIRLFEDGIKTAAEHNIKKVVFASSKAVYSGGEMPWKESDYTVPSSLYGASKLACEQLGLYLAKKNGIQFTALRFAQIIGTGERKGYLINTLIDNAVQKKQQVVFGSGEQKRHYVYIKDVCKAIVCAAENGKSGVFNIGMKNCITNLEMAESVNKAFGNEGNLCHDYTREMSAQCDGMSVEKAERELGFTAEYELDTVFEDIANDLRCGE